MRFITALSARLTCPKPNARPIRHNGQVPDRNGKIFYTSIASLSHINKSARYITYLLTPATACLALPLYRQIQKLREYPLAIVAGILTGVAVNALCVLAVALVFQLGHYDFVTLIPKSVTGAVGMPLAEELGGTGGITMAAISITGIFGNILGPQVLRWFHVTDPVAQGVAMGCGSHAFGTVRALEMGEVEGAMGSLSLVITALLTVVIAPFLGNLI